MAEASCPDLIRAEIVRVQRSLWVGGGGRVGGGEVGGGGVGSVGRKRPIASPDPYFNLF